MNAEDLQAIFSLILVVVLLTFVLGLIIGFWFYIAFQNSKRRRIRERILSSHRDVIGDKRWFPVRYASQPRFDLSFKFFPWEGAGVMVVVTGSALFLGETLSGTPVVLQFAPGNSRINWLGKCPWPNGAVSWLRFDMVDQKHYFSSETGIFVFGSHHSTKAIYDEANQYFGSPAAQNL